MGFLITLFLIFAAWYGVGWFIVAIQGLVSSSTGKAIIKKLDEVATKSEKISPFLALLIWFGPFGLFLKKALYGKDNEE